MKTSAIKGIVFGAIIAASLMISYPYLSNSYGSKGEKQALSQSGYTQTAYFAGGCFWCMEGIFEGQDGVKEAIAGYIGGTAETASYEQVGSATTNHREAVKIIYNPDIISYKTLIGLYWTQIDPTNPSGQFADTGPQYTTAIYYASPEEQAIAEASKKALQDSGKFDKPVATLILPVVPFYPAEEYHQDYYKKSAIRYNLYKQGSGRAAFIKNNWENTIQEIEVSPEVSTTQNTLTGTTSPQETESKNIQTPEGKQETPVQEQSSQSPGAILEATYSDAALKARLTSVQYKVTQEGATETPFKNAYWDNHEAGIYVDVIDGTPLYSSLDKYDSGTGWPTFSKPIDMQNIKTLEDNTWFTTRTEVRSVSSNAHVGHVFDDGPQETGGLRYCMNSAALRFVPVADLEKEGYGEYVKMFQ